ncbi:MAG: hypothetical protein C4K47_05845 [Candidatus Thorarchaeota archaeon]|nr:MAG: hypothetical protein C4K47_05845 [Candidatus Thorarchaeota archaeon]
MPPSCHPEISDIVITGDPSRIADNDDGDEVMVNKLKAVKRDMSRLRKTQNPQQADMRRKRKLRDAKTEFWAMKRKTVAAAAEAPQEDAKQKPKRAEKPEPEELEEETEQEEES